jgi:RNA polymerase sigma factor (sigma-70 family)
MGILEEQLFYDYADFEEKDEPSEDIAELHFRRIQAFPVLSEAEEQDLLQRWCEFKDEKAKYWIVRAHMRMVPPIARNAALKAGFEPNYNMLPSAAKWDAATGFDAVISDLTAAGNLGLVQALGGYRLGQNAKFGTYARTCVRREIWKQVAYLRSVVRRKDDSPALMDLSIDPLLPDVHYCEDYVGSRARTSVSDDPEDDTADRAGKASHPRLRPQPTEPVDLRSILGKLPEDDKLLLIARMKGINLAKIAEALGVSVTTVWRREKSALAKVKAHHGKANSRGASRNPSPSGDNGLRE